MSELLLISAGEMRNFSALSHDALITVQNHISLCASTASHVISFPFSGDYSKKPADVAALVVNTSPSPGTGS